MVKYIVETRNWRDRTYGNPYTSIQVLRADNNQILFSTPMEYGGSGMNQQRAKTELIKRNLIPTDKYSDGREYVDYETSKEYIYFAPVVDGKQRDMFDREDYPENYADIDRAGEVNPIKIIGLNRAVSRRNQTNMTKPVSVRQHTRKNTTGVRKHTRNKAKRY